MKDVSPVSLSLLGVGGKEFGGGDIYITILLFD